MKKYVLLALALLGPVFPEPLAAANKYMVENTSGTNNCYYFGTTPTCSTSITGLSTGTFVNLLNSSNTWTGINTYVSTTALNGPLAVNGSFGSAGQLITSNGSGAASWQTFVAPALASTQTWTGSNTYQNPITIQASSLTVVGAGSGILVTTITFTPTTSGLKGTTTNDSASGGIVGEFLTATGSAVTLTDSTFIDVASITLTPGDWEVWGALTVVPPGGGINSFQIGISTTTGNSSAGLVNGLTNLLIQTPVGNTGQTGASISAIRVPLAASFTYILKGLAQSTTAGNSTGTGRISARRKR